jgi:hypothetical protein
MKSRITRPRKWSKYLHLECYAYRYVSTQPLPPRTNSTRFFRFYRASPKILMSLLFILFLLSIIVYQYHDAPSEARWVKYLVVLGLNIGVIQLLLVDVVRPLYFWWYGLRYGRYAVARIALVEQAYQYSTYAFRGSWEIVVDHTTHTVAFFISRLGSGEWITRLDVGSRVHVLLHPTKPEVLVAFGIVDAQLPSLVDTDQVQLLAELLNTDQPRDVR